jgi:murE/murF fusion protein
VNGVAFDCALFTNLTHDHLDYHGSMAPTAKPRRACSNAGPATAVLNLDDAFGVQLAQALAARGCGPSATRCRLPALNSYLLRSIEEQSGNHSSWGEAELDLPCRPLQRLERARRARLPDAQGIPFAERSGCSSAAAGSGRMQKIGERPLVVVDYAHTPDALDKVLAALEPVARRARRRLVAVFGAGGERDAAKRPLMGLARAARRPHRAHVRQSAQRGSARDHRGDPPRRGEAIARSSPIARGRSKARSRRRRRRRGAARRQGPRELPGDRRAHLPFSDAAVAGAALARRGRNDEPLRSRRGDRRAGARRRDVRFDGVSTDTRSIGKGELFVAIRGERFDGHDFPRGRKGARRGCGLVDDKHAAPSAAAACSCGRHAQGLGRLGGTGGCAFAPALIAITGSNGKTTTKEMLASILRRHAGEAGALATRGNLNTDIGVPLTLLELRAGHRYCADRARHEPSRRDRHAGANRAAHGRAGQQRAARAPGVHAVGRGGRRENASVFDALPPTASRC